MSIFKVTTEQFINAVNTVSRIMHYEATGNDIKLQMDRYMSGDINLECFDSAPGKDHILGITAKDIYQKYIFSITNQIKMTMYFTSEYPLADKNCSVSDYTMYCNRLERGAVFLDDINTYSALVYAKPIIDLDDSDAVAREYYKVYRMLMIAIWDNMSMYHSIIPQVFASLQVPTAHIVDSAHTTTEQDQKIKNYANKLADFINGDSPYVKLMKSDKLRDLMIDILENK